MHLQQNSQLPEAILWQNFTISSSNLEGSIENMQFVDVPKLHPIRLVRMALACRCYCDISFLLAHFNCIETNLI